MAFQCFVKFMDYIELKLVLEMQSKGHRGEVGFFVTSQLCVFNNDFTGSEHFCYFIRMK